MAPRLQILSNVIERLKSLSTSVTGHLYGVLYNNTLTVLTFSINTHDATEITISHTTLQLHMPAEIYLCGVLHVGQCDEKIPDAFKDIDITDNPLLLKYMHNSSVEPYFYIHQKLEAINNIQIISEDDIAQQFTYIRLQGSLPLITQNWNIIDILQDSRKNIASGKVGIHFPSSNVYLFSNEDDLKDMSLKEVFKTSEISEGYGNTRNNLKNSTGYVDAIEANMYLKISNDTLAEECTKYAPVLQYVKRTFDSLECNLNIDTISFVNLNVSSAELYAVLVESICRNIKLIENSLEQFQKRDSTIKLPVPVHFKPQGCGHLFTVVYPSNYTSNETMEYRKTLHKVLALDMTRPYFRHGNALRFRNDMQKDAILINPHETISRNEDSNGKVGIVYGLYAYHHYMQDSFDDNGWGCAYRSLQTIISWYRMQGYTDMPIPSHRTIQKCLVDIGDKPSSFIGSKQWIGSTEVGFILETLLGVTVKILCASNGEEVSTLSTSLLHHFQTQGTPVMIGGGVLAHTILGVSYNDSTGETMFLILDPHYTGSEYLPTVINKGWCGWKTSAFWKKDAFYNMCLPQRPLCF